MRCLFLAPMKHPEDPSPSGDRTMARLFVRLLETLGYDVRIASSLRTVVTEPSPEVWWSLCEHAHEEAGRIAREMDGRAACVFTYHNYYRAPDLVGPELASLLGVPYVIAEPSIAPRRAMGPYAEGHELALHAIERADLLLCLTGNDRDMLERFAPGEKIADLKPFIDLGGWSIPPRTERKSGPVRLLTVAMMRARAKLQSYRILAEALRPLTAFDWTLAIVGDGPVRSDVEREFAGFGDRVRFHGLIADKGELSRLYAASDLFVWPAVDEAFGTVFLEAAAHGVPSVAGGYGGVPDVVIDGRTGFVTEPGSVAGFSEAIARLAEDQALRERLGVEAARFVREERTLEAAAEIVAANFARRGIALPERTAA